LSPNRVYLELLLSKAIKTDENGNWIIEAEASNEDLDFDGQKVLQRALLDSKDYFLQHGIISYDHRHLRADPDDPNWSPEKYIIGEPIGVTKQGKKTFVKAKLYKSSPIARQIVAKLKDGSTRIKTSIGGRNPQIASTWDQKLGRRIQKVVKVLWDELAITFKPVNQTLAPVELSSAAFVKSLQAGFATDASAKTGGGAMITEDLEGTKKPKIWAVVMGMINGDIPGEEEAKQLLKDRGCSAEEADEILRSLIADRGKIRQEVEKMDSELLKAFDESMETLEKSIKTGNGKKDTKTDAVAEKGYADEPPEETVSSDSDEDEYEEGEDGDEDEEMEEENEEEEEEKKAVPSKPSKKKKIMKSLYEEVQDNNKDFLDVTPFLQNLTKSLSKRLDAINERISSMEQVQKSIGNGVLNTGHVLKSIADTPAPRQAVLSRQQRTFLDSNGKEAIMTRGEIITKAQLAVQDGKMSIDDAGVLEERLNKGLPISDANLRLLKSM